MPISIEATIKNGIYVTATIPKSSLTSQFSLNYEHSKVREEMKNSEKEAGTVITSTYVFVCSVQLCFLFLEITCTICTLCTHLFIQSHTIILGQITMMKYNIKQLYSTSVDNYAAITNKILSEIISDSSFVWSPTVTSYIEFGRIQSARITQEKVSNLSEIFTLDKKDDLNHYSSLFSFLDQKRSKIHMKFKWPPRNDTIHSTYFNFWIVIDNPEKKRLNDIIYRISIEYGGLRIQEHDSIDIENELNMLCTFFNYKKIEYKNNKIYIPLVLPNIILLTCHHNMSINIHLKQTSITPWFKSWFINSEVNTTIKLYSNKCDGNLLSELYNYLSFFRTARYSELLNCKRSSIFTFFFNETIHLIYIININESDIDFIRVKLNDVEMKFDISYQDNVLIIWINRNFLSYFHNFGMIDKSNMIGTCNGQTQNITLTITTKNMISDRIINVIALHSSIIIYTSGMYGTTNLLA